MTVVGATGIGLSLSSSSSSTATERGDSGMRPLQRGAALAEDALTGARGTAARWLAQWAENPEAREALVAFGSSALLDFLTESATAQPAGSPQQLHGEQALVNFLTGHHTASRLLARPGALPALLHHVGSGGASPQLAEALAAACEGGPNGADMGAGFVNDDAEALMGMLGWQQGSQVRATSIHPVGG